MAHRSLFRLWLLRDNPQPVATTGKPPAVRLRLGRTESPASDTIPIATPVQFNPLYAKCDRAAPAATGLAAHSAYKSYALAGTGMLQHAFEVHEVHQTSSGGSHVVKYRAEFDLLDASQPFAVEMLSVIPPDSPADAVEIGRQMIQRGATRAFAGTGSAARIRVRDFYIHPVDFKPSRVEDYTYRALRGVLGGAR